MITKMLPANFALNNFSEMKAVAYNICSVEKEPLALANFKKHEITLISNSLNQQTAMFADGKDAVLVSESDEVSAEIIKILADFGVKYILSRSCESNHINLLVAARCGIKVANIPDYSADNLQETANKTIANLDAWQQNKCVGKACVCAKACRVKVAV